MKVGDRVRLKADHTYRGVIKDWVIEEQHDYLIIQWDGRAPNMSNDQEFWYDWNVEVIG